MAEPAPRRLDTYLTRRAQKLWPNALVYCLDIAAPAGGADRRPFLLTREGEADVVLGEGGFRQAREAMDLLGKVQKP